MCRFSNTALAGANIKIKSGIGRNLGFSYENEKVME